MKHVFLIYFNKQAKLTCVVIGINLNYVQLNTKIANVTTQDDTISINTIEKARSDFNMSIDGNEQGTYHI
ncbi:unnamed protein product [Rotaria sp. Silwood2]|nr:unnamed protein product [Rotaria sp. Silwood2]CAF2919511.1 unnamed protein product [Rotaria sp. Silwood2]CAF3076280.1 unnamed protein product [Rotaria sp. Silwood2]CAF3972933.1 unnamed protein product [Rotaria sp. Silwood2]CAF4090634.1 unnamed protein product [Rotaria sp. Silwood2]